jgi:hypothetical protein
VVESDGGAVEHLPEPEQRLAGIVLIGVGVGEVLGLEGYVFRVQGEADYVAGQLGGEGEVELAPVRTAQVELVELVAHDFGAAFRGAVTDELIIEKLEPAAVDFFCFRRGMGDVVVRGHTDWTIHHGGGTQRVGGCWD